ncbi:hypothetical protein EsH8_X_000001 [Colletotrichum jinshuiense]
MVQLLRQHVHISSAALAVTHNLSPGYYIVITNGEGVLQLDDAQPSLSKPVQQLPSAPKALVIRYGLA